MASTPHGLTSAVLWNPAPREDLRTCDLGWVVGPPDRSPGQADAAASERILSL
jgi:hypothetical protein